MNRYCEQVSSIGKEYTYFTWKIENFSRSETEIDEFIESSTFKCLDTSWRLKIYPNGRHNYGRQIILSLAQESSGSRRVNYRVGLKDKFGFEFFALDKNHETSSKNKCFNDSSSYVQTIPRETLNNRANDLLPNDTLTIFCQLEVSSVIHGNVSEKKCAIGSLSLPVNFNNAFMNCSFSDVVLKVGKAVFPAHKIILASRCKVFKGMFESGMRESQENVVNLVEMEDTTARSMLQYIYTGCIEKLTMESAFGLYVAADRYDLPELKECCKAFILKNISADIVCDVAALAHVHSDKELKMASEFTLKKNFKLVLTTEKWKSFAKTNPDLYQELLENAVLAETKTT